MGTMAHNEPYPPPGHSQQTLPTTMASTSSPINRLLLVEDDLAMVALIKHSLEPLGLHLTSVSTLEEARAFLRQDAVEGILLDLGLPDGNGRELLDDLAGDPLSIVVLTARSDESTLNDCLQRGAVDFVRKPFDEMRLRASVASALRQTHQARTLSRLEAEMRTPRGLERLLGTSQAMNEVRKLLSRAAQTSITVLLTGESGTGKEVAARAVHEESPRASQPFVPINCGAIPSALIESELFGHEKGSFTGAHATHRGCFEQAQGGTLFLDEVGDLPREMQVKLLRVLQEQEVMRVGGSDPIPVNVRVLAATNLDLEEGLRRGEFRKDLYYRLAVFPVHMPPLRERPEDVILLAQTLLSQLARQHGRRISSLAPETEKRLRLHTWPGNVRELKNTLERGILLEDSTMLSPSALQLSEKSAVSLPEHQPVPEGFRPPLTREELLPLAAIERIWLERALTLCNWNIREVSRRLGLGRATINRRLKSYGWTAPEEETSSASDN